MDIELTENEIAQSLLDAKIKKRNLLKYEENEKLRHERGRELMKPFDTGELVPFCKRFYKERFGNEFIIDERNRRIVGELELYFINSEIFNKGTYNLNKGILLMGNVGTGKTSIMTFFQKNKKRCFAIKSCIDIAEDYLIYREETEKVYSTPIEKPLHDPAVFFQRQIGYCFDDLGTEEIKNAYGNRKNVLADILLTIYNKKDFEKFHITTNLNEDELKERYGTRIYSRLNEMFNVFHIGGNDRRFEK